MLGDHPVHVVLLATDLDKTKAFFHARLGLQLLSDRPDALAFKCGPTQLTVTKSTTGTSDEQTQASWVVDDLDAELDELRSRGVEIQEYDVPGLKTINGIADIGFARMAWLVDPFKNCLAIMQLK